MSTTVFNAATQATVADIASTSAPKPRSSPPLQADIKRTAAAVKKRRDQSQVWAQRPKIWEPVLPKNVVEAIKATAKATAPINTTNWKHENGKKTVQDLINEIKNGESVLLKTIRGPKKLVRLTTAVWVKILIKGAMGKTYYLVERHQFKIKGKFKTPFLPMGPLVPLIGYKSMPNVGLRYSKSTLPYYTGKPLSEKTTGDDSGPIATAIRGIKEELHIDITPAAFSKDIQVEYFPQQSGQGGGATAETATKSSTTAPGTTSAAKTLTPAIPLNAAPVPSPPPLPTPVAVGSEAAKRQQTYKCKTIPNKLPKNAKRIITWHWAIDNSGAKLPNQTPISMDHPLKMNYSTQPAFSYPTLPTVYRIIHLKTNPNRTKLKTWGNAYKDSANPNGTSIPATNLLRYFPPPPQCFNTYECIDEGGKSVDCQTAAATPPTGAKGGKRRTKKRYKKKKKKRRRKSRKSNKKLKQKRR